jgi:hypothetical protein
MKCQRIVKGVIHSNLRGLEQNQKNYSCEKMVTTQSISLKKSTKDKKNSKF